MVYEKKMSLLRIDRGKHYINRESMNGCFGNFPIKMSEKGEFYAVDTTKWLIHYFLLNKVQTYIALELSKTE